MYTARKGLGDALLGSTVISQNAPTEVRRWMELGPQLAQTAMMHGPIGSCLSSTHGFGETFGAIDSPLEVGSQQANPKPCCLRYAPCEAHLFER